MGTSETVAKFCCSWVPSSPSGIEGADIERNQQPDSTVVEVVVSNIVAVEVFTQLQGMFGAQSVGEVIHELILGDVATLREIEVYAAQSRPFEAVGKCAVPHKSGSLDTRPKRPAGRWC